MRVALGLIHDRRMPRGIRGLAGAGDICGDAGTFYLDANNNPQCAPTPTAVPTGARNVGTPTYAIGAGANKMCGGQVVPDNVDCSPVAPPASTCPSIIPASTDPSVFRSDTYEKQTNLQAICEQADRINQQIAQAGCSDFIGVDVNSFNQTWDNLVQPNGDWYTPGTEFPPGASFFTGSNPYGTDPFVDPCGAHFAAVSTNPSPVVSSGYYLQTSSGITVPSSPTGPLPASTQHAPPAVAPSGSQSTGASSNAVTPSQGAGWFTQNSIISTIPNWAVLGLGLAAMMILPSFMGKH